MVRGKISFPSSSPLKCHSWHPVLRKLRERSLRLCGINSPPPIENEPVLQWKWSPSKSAVDHIAVCILFLLWLSSLSPLQPPSKGWIPLIIVDVPKIHENGTWQIIITPTLQPNGPILESMITLFSHLNYYYIPTANHPKKPTAICVHLPENITAKQIGFLVEMEQRSPLFYSGARKEMWVFSKGFEWKSTFQKSTIVGPQRTIKRKNKSSHTHAHPHLCYT